MLELWLWGSVANALPRKRSVAKRWLTGASPPSDVDITFSNLKTYTSVASRNKIGYVTNTTTKGEHYVRETFLYDEGHIENT